MADQWAVRFRGDVLMGASEGEQRFKAGLIRRRIAVTDLAEGVCIKDGCTGSATHTLTLDFATTTTDEDQIWTKVYQRLQDIWDCVPGTLEVPDFPALPNCIVTNIEMSEQTRIAQPTPLNSASSGFTEGITVQAVITFEQTGA